MHALHPERFTKARPAVRMPRVKSASTMCCQMLTKPPSTKESSSQPHDESLTKYADFLASGSFMVDTFRRTIKIAFVINSFCSEPFSFFVFVFTEIFFHERLPS